MSLLIVVIDTEEPIDQNDLPKKQTSKIQSIANNTFLIESRFTSTGFAPLMAKNFSAFSYYVFDFTVWAGKAENDVIKQLLADGYDDNPSGPPLAVNR